MVASVFSIGWNPVSFSQWIAPNGDTWSIPTVSGFSFCLGHVVREMQDSASMILWAKAARHYNGKGLEQGIVFDFSMQLLKHYRKDGIYDRAAALETVSVLE